MHILNVDKLVCVTVQDRLSKLTQVLVQFKPRFGCYVGSNCHVNILPCGDVIFGIFPRYLCHFIVREYEFCNLRTRSC